MQEIKDFLGRPIEPRDYVVQRNMEDSGRGAIRAHCKKIGRVEGLGKVRARVRFMVWPEKTYTVVGEYLVIVRWVDGKWTPHFDESAPRVERELTIHDHYSGPELTVLYDPDKAKQEQAVKLEPTGQKVLAVRMQDNKAKAKTIKEYLVALLALLWEEGDEFNAKRPFNDLAWEFDLFEALVHANLISGVIEDGNFMDEFDREAGEELIRLAIKALGES
ncbi:hypothetical protein [Nonomuraea typhae]|uniref:Uncharacterized protein n=1 Tax=Nonomuraea typhae TaxID=2603600 RepID=A0ABW7YJH2_9ACTN